MDERAIAMVPARIGSTRLKMKNLALIDGKPMIAWALDAARESGAFERIVLNTDSELFEPIAKRHGAELYLRPKPLGASDAKSDDVVADFMRAHPADAVAWVNPIAPLQPPREVREVVAHFWDQGLDSLITVERKQVHCLFHGRPVNYTVEGKFAQTQDLEPVLPFVYSVMMWRSATFIAEMQSKGAALFCGRFGTYEISKLSGLIIKTEEDLLIADAIARSRRGGHWSLEYDKLAAG